MIEIHFQIFTPNGIKGSFGSRQEAIAYFLKNYPNEKWDEKNLIVIHWYQRLNEWKKNNLFEN